MRTVSTIIALFLVAAFLSAAFAVETHTEPPATDPTGTVPLVAEEVSLPAAPLERAVVLLNADRPQEAIAALFSYRPSREEKSGYHYVYARALVQAQKLYESIEHYRLAYLYAAQEVDKERMLFERAEVYANLGYNSEAVVHFGIFLKQFPRSTMAEQAEFGIAEAYSNLRQYREALAHYEKSGSALRVLYGKANALQSLGKAKEAYDIYRDLIENDPEVTENTSETLYNIGENFRQLNSFAEAKTYLNAVKDDAVKYRAAVSLGRIATDEKKLDQALEYFATAAKSPDRFVRRESILRQAETNILLEKLDEAETALLELRNQFYDGKEYDTSTLLLARLYRNRGKFKEASALLKVLILRRTPSVAALDELEALMLAISERDPGALAKIWIATGRWLMEPTRSEALIKIAQGLRHSGRPLIDVCAWLIRNGTGNTKSQARLLMADYYAGMGEATIALSYIERARVKGHSDQVQRVKAGAYLAGKDPLRASQALMSIQKMENDDLFLLLDAMQLLKNIDQAASFCKQAFEKGRLSVQARVSFADLLHSTGRTGDALVQYRAAVDTKKAGVADNAAAADLEWAYFRIGELTQGEAGKASLKAIAASQSTVGRFAAAELRSKALQKKSDR